MHLSKQAHAAGRRAAAAFLHASAQNHTPARRIPTDFNISTRHHPPAKSPAWPGAPYAPDACLSRPCSLRCLYAALLSHTFTAARATQKKRGKRNIDWDGVSVFSPQRSRVREAARCYRAASGHRLKARPAAASGLFPTGNRLGPTRWRDLLAKKRDFAVTSPLCAPSTDWLADSFLGT